MTLLLLPNVLADVKYHDPYLPQGVAKAVATLDGLIAESETGGRRFLSRFETKKPTREIPISLYSGKEPEEDLDFFLEPIRNGERWGLISDAGLPCVADPGSKLVRRARQTGIAVQAFVGPSSTLMALMLSGLPGQRFAFHGYLPKDANEKVEAIKILERDSDRENRTEIFIEAPYRNAHTLECLLDTLLPETYLAVAWDLTLPTQGVMSEKVAVWKKSPPPNIAKKAATFLISTV